MKKSLYWIGRFRGISGFSQSTRNYVKALLNFIPDLAIGPISALDETDPFNKYCIEPPEPRFEVCNHLPTTNPWADAFFSVIEYDGIPEEWIEAISNAKLIMTQSEFCKRIFSKYCSSNTPISVIPYILSSNFSAMGPKKRYYNDNIFIFGSVFEWVPRKQPYLLIKAFLEAFKGISDVRLLIKTHNHHFEDLYLHLLERGFDVFEDDIKKIVIIKDVFFDLSEFYRGLDCYVSCTAGEGYGQTLCEAMACGIPTIGANHSGNLEFMTRENSFLVDVEDWTPCAEFPYLNWRIPNFDAFVRTLRWIYENKDSDQLNRIRKNASNIAKELSSEKVGKKLFETLKPFLE